MYAVGDARSQLDDIEFRVGEGPSDGDNYPSGLGLEVIVNGISTVTHMERRHVPARLQWIPSTSLRDRDGRRTAYFANCSCGYLECGRLTADVEVAGRYVVWRTAERHFGGPLVFDRSSYRESLEAALAEMRSTETPDEWALRELLDRASWEPTTAAGLLLVNAVSSATGKLCLLFEDDFWQTLVSVDLPWDLADPRGALESGLITLARGELERLDATWRPPIRDPHVRPPYPESWRRKGWEVAFPRLTD